MIGQVDTYFTSIDPYVNNFLLIFIRVTVVSFFIPGISENYISARYKVVIALMLAGLISLAVNEISKGFNIETIITEMVLGFILGIALRTSVFSLQIAGAVIAQSSSIAQIFGGSVSADAQTTVSNILVISGMCLLSMNGFLDTVVIFFIHSYEIFPQGKIVQSSYVLRAAISLLSSAYALSFQMALPFIALSLFYNIILGAINRAMPQLLVSFVGAPAIIAASLGLLLIAIEPLFEIWLQHTYTLITRLSIW